MDIAVFEFGLSNQRSFHRSKLRAFGDTPFGEHTSQKPVYIEHQGEAGSCLSQHGPVWDWMQRSMFRTHRGMRVITLFTPCNTREDTIVRWTLMHQLRRDSSISLSIFGSAVGTFIPIACLHFKTRRPASHKIKNKAVHSFHLGQKSCLLIETTEYEHTFLDIKDFSYYCKILNSLWLHLLEGL